MNTTSTAAYLCSRQSHPERQCLRLNDQTYAAVAPKISGRLAFVITEMLSAKVAVNPATMPNLAASLVTKYSPRIEPTRRNAATMTVMTATVTEMDFSQ